MAKINSQVAVITGGSTGIGLAIALRFREAGYQVAVCSRSPRTSRLPKAIRHEQVDVRNRQSVMSFLESTRKQMGAPTVVVNCAGISQWRKIEAVDEVFASQILDTNILGTLWGCAAAATYLRKGGSIVNVSSLAGKRGSANNSVYCAAKFAVNGITQALAKELGSRRIRVNAVCPVYVTTDTILRSLKETDSPAKGKNVAAYLADFSRTQTALGRLPKEQDVADLVFYLASPQAAAITGQCINVDCGTLPQ